MKPTNLEIKDSACLHVVHILQHPTSRQTTSSTHNTINNAPKRDLSPLPAGRYGKSTKKSTPQRHQVNNVQWGLEAGRVWALGALRSLQSRKNFSAEKRQETHFLCNEEKDILIEDYVARETTVVRKRVQHAETAITPEQEDMWNVEKARSRTTKHESTFCEMLNTIEDRLSDFESSEDDQYREDVDDDEEDTEPGMLSTDDEPHWVMGTISTTVQHRMQSFQQMQMRLHKVTKPGRGNAADYFRARDMKYSMTELEFPRVVKPQTDTTATTPTPTTSGELMRVCDIVPGKFQMPQVTSRQVSSQMRPGWEKHQADNHIVSLIPNAVPDVSLRKIATPVQPVSFYPSV